MFDPLDEDKKKENMTLYDSLLIFSHNIIIYFLRMIQNEVKGSYHDDCFEKKKIKQQHILHIELGHGG